MFPVTGSHSTFTDIILVAVTLNSGACGSNKNYFIRLKTKKSLCIKLKKSLCIAILKNIELKNTYEK